MCSNSSIDVRHSGHAISIADEKIPTGWQFRVIEEGFYEIGSAIFRSIIDYDYLVIIIILIDDGL